MQEVKQVLAVWGRRLTTACALADQYDAVGTDGFEEFLTQCDAVSFAVPPDVQAELAPVAARAGKPLLLEKPIAMTLPQAREMVAAIDATGVPSRGPKPPVLPAHPGVPQGSMACR